MKFFSIHLKLSAAEAAVLLSLAVVSIARGDVGSLGDSNGQIASWGAAASPPPGTYRSIGTGVEWSYALQTDGTIAQWGDNPYGVFTAPSGTFASVSESDLGHAFAIRADGTLAGWGKNDMGQLNLPAGTYKAVAGGGNHSIGLRTDSTLVGAGYNYSGQASPPTGTFTAIAAGRYHSLGIRTDGTLAGWGSNSSGERNVPSGTFIKVAAEMEYSLGIRSNGTIAGWGDNASGRISAAPTGTFTDIGAGELFGLALRSDGNLAAWGDNSIGQCNVPTGTFVAVSAGVTHGLALRARNDYSGDLLVSGIGVNANLNRSVTVGGNATIASAMNLYSNPTMSVNGQLTVVSGGNTIGDGVINCPLIEVQSGGTFGGTLDITGNVTNAGNLQIGSGGTRGSITGNIVNNGALTFNRSDDYACSGNISGSQGLSQAGAGVLTLSGTNSYGGLTAVNAGTLRVGAAANLGSGTSVVLNGGSLDLRNNAGTSFGKNITVGNNATINVDRAANGSGSNQTHTLGALSIGDQTLTVTGGNGYGLTMGDVTASSSATINNNAPGTLTMASLTETATAAKTVTIDGTGNTIVAGAITQNGANALSLTKTGTGSLTLTGSVATPYLTGDTKVDKGTLAISNGGQFTNNQGYVGSLSGSSGNALVSGDGSTWRNTGSLYVGGDSGAPQGTGLLTVQSGGSVNVTNTLKVWSSGAVNLGGGTINTGTLDNAGTFNWTAGTLNLTNSGLTVEPSANPFGGSPTIGTGKRLTMSQDLIVGQDGSATMTISGGGTVSNQNAKIGRNSAAVGGVIVSGEGSTWNTAGDLRVADAGKGYLSVLSGAVVSSNRGFVGAANTYAYNNAYVSGVGSRWNAAGDLQVGGAYGTTSTAGAGQLVVSSGGSVSSGGDLYLARGDGSANNSASVTVDGAGSRLTVADDMFVGYSGGLGIGSLNVNYGALVDVGNTLNIPRGFVYLNGGTIRARTVDYSSGNFYFNSGTLELNNNLTVSVNDDLKTVLGGSHTVGFDRNLTVDYSTTLLDVLAIKGGTFSTGSLVNPGFLQFESGKFNLTSANLTVGSGGLLGSTLSLPTTKAVGVTNNTIVASGGKLDMQGGAFSSGMLTNQGMIGGIGQINAPLTNAAAGKVRAFTGETLTFTGALHSNQGQLQLYGGAVEFNGALINATGALITGNGNLIANHGLANSGTMAFSATANVSGDVTNNLAGKITSAGGTTTFWDDVVNQGEIRTSSESFSVFYGSLSGSGTFTGPGTVLIEGDLKPGNSPTIGSFGGSLTFGPTSTLEIELAGLSSNSPVGFDQLHVAGTLTLGGTLDVVLLDGFQPLNGNLFDILDFGTLTGQFDAINLPTLGGNLSWDTSSLYTLGVLTVVPEPSAIMLTMIGAASLLAYAWRRRAR